MSGRNEILAPGKLPGRLLSELLRLNPVTDERVLIGPGTGRDAAAIRFGDSALVVKTDPITFPTDRAIHHLVHVNANDIACQGATPRWLLVTALLPHGKSTAESVSAMFADLMEVAGEVGVQVVGGHTEITIGLDRPLLIGTMLGETSLERLVDPTRALPGDRILMTKSAGIEGTVIIATELREALEARGIASAVLDRAASMLADPGISVLREALALAEAGAVSAMHDPTEGGVATALAEVASAGECGLIVSSDSIPVAPETEIVSEAAGVDPLGLLASGSLLAVVPKDRIEAAEAALYGAKVPFAWIGKLTPVESGLRMRSGSVEFDLPEFPVDEVARILTE